MPSAMQDSEKQRHTFGTNVDCVAVIGYVLLMIAVDVAIFFAGLPVVFRTGGLVAGLIIGFYLAYRIESFNSTTDFKRASPIVRAATAFVAIGALTLYRYLQTGLTSDVLLLTVFTLLTTLFVATSRTETRNLDKL